HLGAPARRRSHLRKSPTSIRSPACGLPPALQTFQGQNRVIYREHHSLQEGTHMNARFALILARLGAILLLAAAANFGLFATYVSAAPATEPPLRRIEVSLSQQRLYAWLDGTLVYEFAVTTGQAGEETLPGEYEILDKETDAYSDGWQLEMPFWMGIYQFSDYEDGFHALPSDDAGD